MIYETPSEGPRNAIASDFATALALDLAAKNMNERLLGQQIGLTQQAINKWRARGFPPPYRLEQLRGIFGPDSHVARIPFASMVQGAPRLRMEAPVNVPQVPNAQRITHNVGPPTFQAEARADAAWADLLRHLPPQAREHTQRATLVVAGAGEVAVDFLSPRLALEFRTVGASGGVCLSSPLIKLAALKLEYPARRAVMCLLNTNALNAEAQGHIRFAEVLGVEVWVVHHAMEAAAMISGIEAYPWRGGAEAP